jgi:hypothetical protein
VSATSVKVERVEYQVADAFGCVGDRYATRELALRECEGRATRDVRREWGPFRVIKRTITEEDVTHAE